MKVRQLIAGVLTAAILLTLVLPSAGTVFAASTESAEVFNKEGLWLTEIYQNDVDRSKKNNNRDKNGYEEIPLYTSTTDLMEFIEVTSTHEADIKLNDLYDVYYGDQKLDITTMDGSGDITLTKGQAVVLWNVRTDVKSAIPTEEEFRAQMRIPESALLLKAVCGVNWAADGATFSIKAKDGTLVSTFTATTAVDTQDGFSVELKIPNIGPEMEVYRELTLPSGGYVYSAQLNGLVQAKVPEADYAKGVYLTEIRPNDVSRAGEYGISDDFMECFEIVNTTDKEVDLNKDYQLIYAVKEGARKPIPVYYYAENVESMSAEGCVIPAGKAAVIWCYRINTLSGYTRFPTEADFRAAYSIPEDVPVYLFTNQNGMNNTTRGVEIYQKQADGSRTLVSCYSYVGATDCKDNTSAQLMVNPEGPAMQLYTGNAATTMGTVDAAQLAYVKDDGSALTLQLNDTVPESVMQGEELRVNFSYDVTGALPRTGITTYYRFDGTGKWYSSTEAKRRVPNLYEVLIPADELFSHDYVDFYVSADNRYRSTLSPIYRVAITKLNDIAGIRTNISDKEEVSGTISVTANDGGDNLKDEIYLDGEKLTTSPMLEDGAYFTFHADGRDSYFKNAVTTTENEWIAAIGKWQYTILDGQAIHVDNRYFTYHGETDSYDITLRVWAGTYGATVDEYLLPTANREDFKVTQLALRLINGKIYYPTKIGPDDPATSAKTNLSTDYDAIHSIGDSAGWCPYMDVSFSVPASEVTAVGTQVDTKTLADGEHTLLVTNGESRQSVGFIVDNKAPELDLGFADGSNLSGMISLDPQVKENGTLKKFSVTLDGKEIETPYQATAYALGKGEHIVAAYAEDMAGNVTTKTAVFTVSDTSITLSDASAADITDSGAKLYLSLQSGSAATATFYQVKEIANIQTNTAAGILPYIQYTVEVGEVNPDRQILVDWDGTASSSDNTHASALFVQNTVSGNWDKLAAADETGAIPIVSFPAENHVKDGKATIIVQCTADSALPELDAVTDGKKDTGSNWDGASVPEDYDFCFAWETDTQYYAEEWQHHFLNMNQWIVDNAERMKIKYTIHTGDIVDDYDMLYEWENADQAMGIFDEVGMPYGVLGGNHDVAAGLGQYENYYTYFGEDRFRCQPTYGGSYKNNTGHYDLISEKGQDFIIVYMSWNIYQEEIDWMNAVLQQYSDRKAILCFHTYTRVKYSGDSLLDYFGELVQKEVVAKNPNVFAVLNGHYHGSSYETAMFDDNGDGVNDRTVYQICTDYQSGFEGGNEYMKFLYFDLDNDKIYVNSYSPCLDDFNFYDNEQVEVLNREGASAIGVDKMLLDVEFHTDEQTILENSFHAYLCDGEELGTAQLDPAAGTASLAWNGLDAQTEYAWYAVVSNGDGDGLNTGVYRFTTDKKADVAPNPDDGGDTPKPGDGEDTPKPGDGEDTPKPDDGEKPDTGSTGTGDSPSTPQTGDTGIMVPFVLAVISAAGLCVMAFLGKKSRHS